MNVTKGRFNNRQLHMEDYLQMVSAEQREYAEVLDYQRIAENNHIITDFWTNSLLELILRKDNLNKAYRRVKKNKGSGGIDGMQTNELLSYLIVVLQIIYSFMLHFIYNHFQDYPKCHITLFKPDYAHKILLSKNEAHYLTRMRLLTARTFGFSVTYD